MKLVKPLVPVLLDELQNVNEIRETDDGSFSQLCKHELEGPK